MDAGSGRARLAEPEDLEALIECRFAYFEAEGWDIELAVQREIRDQLIEYLAAELGRNFQAALVTGDAGEVISVAFLAITERPANPRFPSGRIGTVLNVYTRPEYRRQGYARSVLELLIGVGAQAGLSYLELSASASGQSLYRRLGFIPTEPNGFTPMRLPLRERD